MSISLKEFRNGNFKKRIDNVNEHPVLVFLKKNKRAYKYHEIAKILKMNKWTVRTTLRKLMKKRLVAHKTPYWAYSKHC